jgi:hypothetical protein
MADLKLSSHPARGTTDTHGVRHEAWWYEDAKGIDVYIRDPIKCVTVSCRIPRRTLLDWLERTK